VPIISRMIKNSGMWLALALLAGGCDGARADEPEPYQGVVELEERVLGFEVGGRLSSVTVERGDEVESGTELAALDSTLESLAREARAAEVEAARAQVDLLREGPRREEIRAAAAELRAARSTESLLHRNLERQERLHAQGATTDLALDELQAQLAQATSRKQAVAQRLSALREGARTQEIAAAEAQLAAAETGRRGLEERLKRYTLEVGMGGTVLDVHAEPGEVVAPGAPVVTVADVAHPYVDVFVPQQEVGGIEIGTPATVRVDTYDRGFAGRVEDVARRTEFTPRFLFSEQERPNLVVRVRVRVDDPEGALVAGVPAFVTVDREGSP